jgi:uncharacterized membrane protein YqjE
MPTTPPASKAPPGLIGSIRGVLATAVSLLRTRLELLSTDFEDQRQWLSQTLILAAAALLGLSFGLLLLTFFVVVCFWDSHRLIVLAGFTLLYLGAGVGAVMAIRQRAKNRPRLLASTMDELSKDYQRLTFNP